MKYHFIFSFILFQLIISSSVFSQSKVDTDIEAALTNARKGIFWGLMNIPVKKAKLEKSLINNDMLIAKVKIAKELNGVKIESTGYNNTNEVTIVLYRSADSLIKDGYIKKGDLEIYSDDE
ncbi:MAG: hypothetical protein HRF52_11345 [Ignavibacterium sp.]|jgi:hypothetical protein|uniref:hypothetical protein n=1 Tax=Ignavibacterium sp. TaxID=2651167 RepID=UPI0032968C7B